MGLLSDDPCDPRATLSAAPTGSRPATIRASPLLKGCDPMRLWLLVLAQVAGVLSGPDPAQMEKAPDLGYRPVLANLILPDAMKMGAPSSVAILAGGDILVFNRGEHPFMEFDAKGTLVRTFGEGRYVRPHGMRLDSEGNIW